ncbi:hypothetical protein [Microvirga soli]|uniref:hypothetical protein n=1 Tax=Microvirga soli TaxID=1854496 RepID=UPI00191F6E40|nr:hypothetical protein [Microvirga soli]
MMTLDKLRSDYQGYVAPDDADAIERVLAAVGLPLSTKKGDFERDLAIIATWYQNPLLHRRSDLSQDQTRWIMRFRSRIDKFLTNLPLPSNQNDPRLELLWVAAGGARYEIALMALREELGDIIPGLRGDDEEFSRLITPVLNRIRKHGSVSDTLERLHGCLLDMKALLSDMDDVPSQEFQPAVRDPSRDREIMLLLAVEVYEFHFQRDFGISRHTKTGEISGPDVRFVAALLRELGVRGPNGKELSSETIVRSWQQIKSSVRERRQTDLFEG